MTAGLLKMIRRQPGCGWATTQATRSQLHTYLLRPLLAATDEATLPSWNDMDVVVSSNHGRPGAVTFLLQFYLLVSHKQLQLIP